MKKWLNCLAIKHVEMLSGVAYKNNLTVPAGVRPRVCVREGDRRDLLQLQGSATSQLLGVLTRWPRTKRALPPSPFSRTGTPSNGVRIQVCEYANISHLAVSARTQGVKLLFSQPSARIAPRCRAYVRNRVRRRRPPSPLNVSTGCRSPTGPPG